jgi:hypothetical protein
LIPPTNLLTERRPFFDGAAGELVLPLVFALTVYSILD